MEKIRVMERCEWVVGRDRGRQGVIKEVGKGWV